MENEIRAVEDAVKALFWATKDTQYPDAVEWARLDLAAAMLRRCADARRPWPASAEIQPSK